MNRTSPGISRPPFLIGEWTVHPSLNRIESDSRSEHLEPKIMDLLLCLAEKPGSVVGKRELLDRVWGVEHISDGTLSHAIADLRRKLGDNAREPRYIATIHKRGYRLLSPVRPAAEPDMSKKTALAPSRRRPLWALAAISIIVIATSLWFATQSTPQKSRSSPRIVILPFDNLGGADNEAFTVGVTNEIISRLATLRDLEVISATTAFHLDTRGMSARDIARELHVDYILEGSIRWSSGKEPATVRISPQLIHATDDRHLWQAQFDRKQTDTLDVQSEIARQIAHHLELQLDVAESRILTTPPTNDPGAYRAYLKALERRGSFDQHDIQTSAQMFRLAVQADPQFAQAWAGLAESNSAMHHFGYDRRPDRCESAKQALSMARKLDPAIAETLRATAFYHYHCEGDAQTARIAFEKALQRWPGDTLTMRGLAYACRRTNDWAGAETWLRRALELDPNNATTTWNLGLLLLFRHREAEALATIDEAIALDPSLRGAHFARCNALWQGWADTESVAATLAHVPGPHDSTWFDFAIHNAYFSGDFEAARHLAEDMPPGPLRPYHQCLAAFLSESADSLARCNRAKQEYRDLCAGNQDAQWPHLLLAKSFMLAGNMEEALREAAEAVSMRSIETDVIGHHEALRVQAQIQAAVGQLDQAAERVTQLLRSPSNISPAMLQIDPLWAPLRSHPDLRNSVTDAAPVPAPHSSSPDRDKG